MKTEEIIRDWAANREVTEDDVLSLIAILEKQFTKSSELSDAPKGAESLTKIKNDFLEAYDHISTNNFAEEIPSLIFNWFQPYLSSLSSSKAEVLTDDDIYEKEHEIYSCPRCGGMGSHVDGGDLHDCNYPQRQEERDAFCDGAKFARDYINNKTK